MTDNNKSPIQLFVPSFRIEETLAEIRQCLERGWTGLGFKTVEMEQRWNQYTGLPFSHFINSNTSGLHLAFHLLRKKFQWDDGDEIITTPITFVSTNHAILYERLKPVFADVDSSLCLDPRSVAERITARTRAVIFVGLGGKVGAYEEILALCRRKNIAVILDAAHMAGTRVGGVHVGHDADCTVFSFQAVKNLPTADSGMVCFADGELDQQARQMSWLGINKDTYARSESRGAYKWQYDVDNVGFKYNGNAVMAAMGLVSLKYLDADNAYRRQIARWYREDLEGSRLEFVAESERCETAQHLVQVFVPRREEVMLALNQAEIFPGVHYRDNTDYAPYRHAQGTCPTAHELSKRVLSLPNHLQLSREDVRRISKTLRSIVAAQPSDRA